MFYTLISNLLSEIPTWGKSILQHKEEKESICKTIFIYSYKSWFIYEWELNNTKSDDAYVVMRN